MLKNENRPPNGSVFKVETIRVVYSWKDSEIVKNEKIIVAEYRYAVDKNGLPLKDYRRHKHAYKRWPNLFSSLINKPNKSIDLELCQV